MTSKSLVQSLGQRLFHDALPTSISVQGSMVVERRSLSVVSSAEHTFADVSQLYVSFRRAVMYVTTTLRSYIQYGAVLLG